MYKYYSAMRPIVPGGYPKTEPVRKVINFDAKQLIPSIGERVWGYIEYEHPLTAEDVAKYELILEPPYEDKAQICRLLCKAIQSTRAGAELLTLEYDAEHDFVSAYFRSGYRAINVAGDSGMAMIRDIVNRLEI